MIELIARFAWRVRGLEPLRTELATAEPKSVELATFVCVVDAPISMFFTS